MTKPTPVEPHLEKSGTASFRLADGTVLHIAEWLDTELRASFDLIPNGKLHAWEPFVSSRSMPLQESGGPATRADTNIPMAGDRGLPRDWEFMCYGWRATIGAPRAVLDSDELASWSSNVYTELHYNGKHYADTTLSDLRKALLIEAKADAEGYTKPEDMPGPFMQLGGLVLPIHFRMGLSYGVRVSAERPFDDLRRLIGKLDTRVVARFHLRGLLKRCIV